MWGYRGDDFYPETAVLSTPADSVGLAAPSLWCTYCGAEVTGHQDVSAVSRGPRWRIMHWPVCVPTQVHTGPRARHWWTSNATCLNTWVLHQDTRLIMNMFHPPTLTNVFMKTGGARLNFRILGFSELLCRMKQAALAPRPWWRPTRLLFLTPGPIPSRRSPLHVGTWLPCPNSLHITLPTARLTVLTWSTLWKMEPQETPA